MVAENQGGNGTNETNGACACQKAEGAAAPGKPKRPVDGFIEQLRANRQRVAGKLQAMDELLAGIDGPDGDRDMALLERVLRVSMPG